MRLWHFSSGEGSADGNSNHDSTAIKPFSSVSDTDGYQRSASGEEATIPGSSVEASVIERAKSEHKGFKKLDARVSVMDVESIEVLMRRYGKELVEAEKRMEARKREEAARLVDRYDYEQDKRFKTWQDDCQKLQDKLNIHWLDLVLDRWKYTVIYSLRLWTTAGLFYGTGRTAYLYRTMDKQYAKKYGVNFFTIAFDEITMSVAKGGAAALASVCGGKVGLTLSCLVSSAIHRETAELPDRRWWHITLTGTVAAVFGAATIVGLHRHHLSTSAKLTVFAAMTGAGVLASLYLGYAVYRPFAAKRSEPLYSPHWRPWNERCVGYKGQGPAHGRYY